MENSIVKISEEQLQNDFLKNVKYNDVPFFNLNGYKTLAKCVKIYDGDTGTFVFYLYDNPYKFRIRLAGIDTAEIKSDDTNELELGLKAKNRLKELIGDRLVYLECLKYDKYGRILANVYDNENKENLYNKILVDEKLAYNYDGGKRKNFSEWKQ